MHPRNDPREVATGFSTTATLRARSHYNCPHRVYTRLRYLSSVILRVPCQYFRRRVRRYRHLPVPPDFTLNTVQSTMARVMLTTDGECSPFLQTAAQSDKASAQRPRFRHSLYTVPNRIQELDESDAGSIWPPQLLNL